jgi:uncharacterized protein YndB with AHSA1/START domain
MAHDDQHPHSVTATERIDRDVLIPAPPEHVWDVITSDGWLAEQVELELMPGGDARFADPGSVRTGWVEEVIAPEADADGRLVFWWGPEGEPATRVELVLRPLGDGTWVRVAETRPLEALHLVGAALPGQSGASSGPAMLAVA